MNQLFPIIRRKRRPLLPVESLLPVATTKGEPEQNVATVPPVVPPETDTQPKDDEAA